MSAAAPSRYSAWHALLLLQLFRSGAAAVLLGFSLSGGLDDLLSMHDPTLFRFVNFLYLFLSLGGHLLIALRLLPFQALIYLLYGVDLLVYAVLLHAAGGVISNLQLLLFISLFGTVVLGQGRAFLAPAAAATLAVLLVEITAFLRAAPQAHLVQAGLYSASFFCAVLIGAVLARRTARGELLAAQWGRQFTRQAELNERIVQLLHAGILVIGEHETISMFNGRAAQLLGLQQSDRGRALEQLLPGLREITRSQGPHTLVLRLDSKDIQVSSMPGERDRDSEWILLVEDLVPIRRRMQQMKLASLGQLTAGIAHEVRTPLAAISHAAQLLGESHGGREVAGEEAHLLRIIDEHCRRLGRIVDNVMSLGRNRPAVVERFELLPWLREFVVELVRHKELAAADVKLAGRPGLWVRADSSQLHQVLWNLSENALRYSRSRPRVLLRCGRRREAEQSEELYLEVHDNGPGVPVAQAEQLFEPFFTTESGGSGLGLYVAHELCQANHALLTLQENSPQGCIFRVSFGARDERDWGQVPGADRRFDRPPASSPAPAPPPNGVSTGVD